mmetsp:Transcript_34849/g.26015  ORF Transcript_34849/g.26015 Transcript_34849/m.26015 type:complete len:163 (+) Transcript_34849:2354-2842(+)
MKEWEVSEYPDPLIEASCSFLRNPQLLTVFVTTIFKKTNAYDSISLQQTMVILTKWIKFIEALGIPFPRNFDFSFFLLGINRALEFDHHLATSSVIWCLYQTIHYFPSDQRVLVVSEILKKHFFKFFFSWSPHIRDMFFYLVLYQIEHNFLIKCLCEIGLEF